MIWNGASLLVLALGQHGIPDIPYAAYLPLLASTI